MNRKQRRAAEKKISVANKASTVPLAPKVGMREIINKEIEKALDRARLDSSNETLNLISSAFLIVLKEFHEFENEKLKDVLREVFEQLELCGSELVTIDEMMDLCKSYGIETFIDDTKMNELGKKIFDKQKVFEQLDKGLTEIEDIHRATGVNSKDVSAYRWQYNTKKYGGVYMSKMDKVFKLLDQGVTDIKVLTSKTGLKESSVRRYMSDWKNTHEVKTKDDIDALADAIFGKEEQQEEVGSVKSVASIEGVVENKKCDTEENKTVPVEDEIQVEDCKMILNIPGKKKGPKITRKIEIEGEFGAYVIENKVVDVHIACANMALEKQQLLEFIEELQVVAGEMQ